MRHKSKQKSRKDYLISAKDYSSLVDCDPEYLISDYFERAWNNTKNPLFVWVGIKACQKYEIDFPDWIKIYLYDCSVALTTKKPQEGKKGAFFVSDALQTNKGGQGAAFISFHKYFEDFSIFQCYCDIKDNNWKISDEKVYEKVGDIFGVSPYTIQGRNKIFNKT